jgi:hypothetical protein
MSHITTIVLTKGIVSSIITLIIAFIGFTICSFFGLDTAGISYVAPFVGMMFAVSIGGFSIDTIRNVNGGFLSGASPTKIVAVLSILSLIVFFIVTGFAMPFLFKSSFSPNEYYGISYNIFMILYAVVWILFSVYRTKVYTE